MSQPKLLYQGAEAKIFLNKANNLIIKDRIKKSYRMKGLDEKIRRQRTKKEKKLLEKSSKIIHAPDPFPLKRFNEIEMPFIDGQKLSKNLDLFSLKKQKKICHIIGKETAKLHNADIIHGDLTTSNMILKDDNIYFIDFGLGFISRKIEDKSVDLHLFKQALEAKHFKNWEFLFKEFIKGYKDYKESNKVLERLKSVEKRGRYKN